MTIRVGGGAGSGTSSAPSGTYATGALGYTIDKPGVYVPAGWGGNWFPARDAHATALAEVVVKGDSTTYGQRNDGGESYPWVQSLRQLAVDVLGYTDGGLGELTFPTQGATFGHNYGVEMTGVSNTPVFDGPGDWGGGPPNALPSGTLSFQTAVASDTKTFYFKEPTIRLYYLKDSGFVTGSFTYSLNGATAVSVNATIGSGRDWGYVTLNPGAATSGAPNTVKIVNGSGYVAIALDAINATGIVFHSNGIPSINTMNALNYSQAVSPSQESALSLGLAAGSVGASAGTMFTAPSGPRSIKLAITQLGINDQQGATASVAGMQAAAGNIQQALGVWLQACKLAGADALVVVPHLLNAGNAAYRGIIAAAIFNVAREYSAAVVSFDHALGFGASRPTYGPHMLPTDYDTQAKFLWDNVLGIGGRTGTGNKRPFARLKVSSTTGNTPASITLDASASYTRQAGATITSYTFDPGDGTGTTTQAGATLAHSYTVAGTYSPKVTVTDSNGLTATVVLPSVLTTTTVTYLVTDTFTAPDNTLLSAHTADTGQSWAGAGLGSYKITSNAVNYFSGGGSAASIDAAATGKRTTVDVSTVAVGGQALIAAFKDASNYIGIWFTTGVLQVRAMIGGVGSFPTPDSASGSVGSGPVTLAAEVVGGVLKGYINGTLALTYTLTGPQATAISGYTAYGLFGQANTTFYDNFHVIA